MPVHNIKIMSMVDSNNTGQVECDCTVASAVNTVGLNKIGYYGLDRVDDSVRLEWGLVVLTNI